METEVSEVKPPVFTSDHAKDHAAAIKPAETSTQSTEKGVTNKAMDYEVAMTSPTELLAPEVFPDITDMNGNAMSDKHKSRVDFHGKERSSTRCLLWVLIFFIAISLIMTALFTWKMIEPDDSHDANTITRKCNIRTKPVRFERIPTKIEQFLGNWEEVIMNEMKKEDYSLTRINVVYYDRELWKAKCRWNGTTKEFKNEKGDKLFPAGSVTKVITDLFAFKLYNDGVIGLDDPLVKYEPNFWVRNPFRNDNGTKITIRELITYSSGLPREAPCYQDNKESYCPHNTSYILQQLRKKTTSLLFPPGSDVLYGNLPFALAGNALAKKYPGGFNKYIHDIIFEPLNMTSSSFLVNDTEDVYRPADIGGKTPNFKHWGWLDPAGGLLTTVEDLARLEIALFNNSNSQFLRSAILDEFYTPSYFFPDRKLMLGNAWEINWHKGYLEYTKGGYVYGYDSMIVLLPRLRLAVNVLSTTTKVLEKIQPKIRELFTLFHEELVNLPQHTQRMPVFDADRFIGEYQTDDVITLIDVPVIVSRHQRKNNTHDYLSFNLSGYKFPLNYIGDYVFEMIQENLCIDFFLGIHGDRIYFKKPKNPNDKVMEFVIYGVHLRGKVTFRRKNRE